MSQKLIKTSTHSVKFANTAKKANIIKLINECRRVAKIYLDYIWENGYNWTDKDETPLRFSIKENLLYFPPYIDYNLIKIETFLTARCLCSLTNQLAGIISSSTEKQRKRLFMLAKLKAEGVSRFKRAKLIKKIKTNIPQKPYIDNLNPEFSSKCCDFNKVEGEFDGFLKLKSITKDKMEISIPIQFTKHSNKLVAMDYEMKASFLIKTNAVDLRWEKEKPETKESGITVGCDQGMKDMLTFSDNQSAPKTCPHGHSLESIMDDLCRKRKGSKGTRRAQAHRKNFINWAWNQIDLSNINQINLEKIWNIGYKSTKSRKMSHWTNTLIRDKGEAICEEGGVRLIHQSSTYRSQRCSECGIVRKANRKGKVYLCKHCGNEVDADLNAALNHEINLPEIPYALRKLNKNRKDGFYWLETGFFDYSTGRSLESLPLVEVEPCHQLTTV